MRRHKKRPDKELEATAGELYSSTDAEGTTLQHGLTEVTESFNACATPHVWGIISIGFYVYVSKILFDSIQGSGGADTGPVYRCMEE